MNACTKFAICYFLMELLKFNQKQSVDEFFDVKTRASTVIECHKATFKNVLS